MLVRKPGALHNGAPFGDLGEAGGAGGVRRRLTDAEDGNRQMVDIRRAI